MSQHEAYSYMLRQERDEDYFARIDYLREAFGPSSLDAHIYELSEAEARDFMRAFLDETEITCPSCGTEMILVFDNDGYHTWLHEIWRTCSCGGMILDVTTEGREVEILVFEFPNCGEDDEG